MLCIYFTETNQEINTMTLSSKLKRRKEKQQGCTAKMDDWAF